MSETRPGWGLVLAALVLATPLRVGSAASPGPGTVFIPLADARPVFEASQDVPAELKTLSPEALAEEWPRWVAKRDASVRSRVARGEEDSLAFFLVYGVSFTSEPRATDGYRETLVRRFGNEPEAHRRVDEVLKARARDLANALSDPGDDERRLTMLDAARRAGHDTKTEADRDRLAPYLYDNLFRCLRSYQKYTAEVAAAAPGAAAFASPPSLFQDRGLSTDTSLTADYAVEQALLEAMKEGVLGPASVRRAAVIGPGLDLIDKDGGYDLHPPQSTQPFVLIDTLLRLGLADRDRLEVTPFDVSPRVVRHLDRAVKRAGEGRPYEVLLVRDPSWNWSPGMVQFWETVGARIGTAAAPQPSPRAEGVLTRAIAVEPRWVGKLRPTDLDIVYQRLPLADADRFDLLIATNILVYYSPFEQGLALRNAARMLRPGGILLSNTALPEIGDPDMQRIGATSTAVGGTSGHSVLWYRRGP